MYNDHPTSMLKLIASGEHSGARKINFSASKLAFTDYDDCADFWRHEREPNLLPMTSLHELRMASQYKRSDHIVATILELEGYLAKTVSQHGTKSPDLVGPFTALLEQFRKHLKFAIEADALEAMMKADR